MPHYHNPDFLKTTLLSVWAAARVAGYRLVWDPKTRAIVLRPLSGGAR
jgi:hypothetical protein